MHITAGRLLFAHRYPRGRRAKSGVFSIPESAGAQNCAESPDSEPQRLKSRSFSTGCAPWCLPFAQNPVCRHPRLLKTPKNARRILHQAPVARRRIAPASPVTAGDPRAYLPNLSAGRKDPAARSARRGPDMSEDDLGGKPWGLRWGRFQPGLFVAEADAQRLGLAYQVALGIDILELAGDILERHVAHLAVTQGNHVAKLAA